MKLLVSLADMAGWHIIQGMRFAQDIIGILMLSSVTVIGNYRPLEAAGFPSGSYDVQLLPEAIFAVGQTFTVPQCNRFCQPLSLPPR